jgi:Formin Homology 2 Domain
MYCKFCGSSKVSVLLLCKAKAFDKKTSVLHYLVKLIKRNNESLLGLRDDLRHLKEAEFVVLDNLCGEIKSLKEEIEPVLQIVKAQAEDLEEKGQLTQMSIKELAEQKTSVRTVGCVPLYNKMEHHTGRTPMERFTLNAAGRIEDALVYTETVKVKFSKVLDYFGEDSNIASNDFFGTMNTFLNDFTKAVDHVTKEEIAKVSSVLLLLLVVFDLE